MIVGDYRPTVAHRAGLLEEWNTFSTDTKHAAAAMRARPYHLLIFCEHVPQTTAKRLIRDASQLNPDLRVLVIYNNGKKMRLGSAKNMFELWHAGTLRDLVASLLGSARRHRPGVDGSRDVEGSHG